jgi:hypothetical protein
MRIFTSYLLAIVLLVLMATYSYAGPPESLCPSKTYEKGTIIGTLSEVGVDEGGVASLVVQVKENENFFMLLSYGDVEKVKSFMNAEQVKVTYKLKQYWDDHDGVCFRGEWLDNIVRVK